MTLQFTTGPVAGRLIRAAGGPESQVWILAIPLSECGFECDNVGLESALEANVFFCGRPVNIAATPGA